MTCNQQHEPLGLTATNTEGPRLLTTKQASMFLNVSEVTLRQWRHKREGPPCVKLGSLVRYDKDRLEEWLAEQYAASAAEYG